jgi:hypothetical protein
MHLYINFNIDSLLLYFCVKTKIYVGNIYKSIKPSRMPFISSLSHSNYPDDSFISLIYKCERDYLNGRLKNWQINYHYYKYFYREFNNE